MFLAAAAAPELTLVAYVGGSGTDDGDGITLDGAGNIYLACHSDSPDFPHLPPKAPPASRDAMDAVVVKVEAQTGRVAWATRTGGSAWDAAGDLHVSQRRLHLCPRFHPIGGLPHHTRCRATQVRRT